MPKEASIKDTVDRNNLQALKQTSRGSNKDPQQSAVRGDEYNVKFSKKDVRS